MKAGIPVLAPDLFIIYLKELLFVNTTEKVIPYAGDIVATR